MRVNVYSQELTNDIAIIEKYDNWNRYSAIMLLLHSSDMLHQPPDHQGNDDDRSAVTFWLPRSPERREAFAKTLEQMASLVRSANPETDPEEVKARLRARDHFNNTVYIINMDKASEQMEDYVSGHWKEFR